MIEIYSAACAYYVISWGYVYARRGTEVFEKYMVLLTLSYFKNDKANKV
jgi:hypothetical protein